MVWYSTVRVRSITYLKEWKKFDIRWFDRSNYIPRARKDSISRFDIRKSNVELSNLIEYRTFMNPSDVRSIEPSNLIEYRDILSIKPFDNRNSSLIEYPTIVRRFDIRRLNIELFETSNIRRFGNPTQDAFQFHSLNEDIFIVFWAFNWRIEGP